MTNYPVMPSLWKGGETSDYFVWRYYTSIHFLCH